MFGRGIQHHWSARRAEVMRERRRRRVEIVMLTGLVVAQTLQARSEQDAMVDGP